jgi:hypothetical protein
VSRGDDFDIKALRIDPAKFAAPPIPAKIRKRRQLFAMVPMWWYEKLANPMPTCRCTCLVAWYVLHLHWKGERKPFKLANGMLAYDGISPDSKLRAIKELEQRGLITVEWRLKKSPIIHVHVEPATSRRT